MDLIQAIQDEKLFRPCFRDLSTWQGWISLLKAFFGLTLDSPSLEIYQHCTGREHPPDGEFKEAWVIAGRRGGKSFISAIVAVSTSAWPL